MPRTTILEEEALCGRFPAAPPSDDRRNLVKKFLFLVFGLLIFVSCGSDDVADSANEQITYEPTATSSLATEIPEEAEESAEAEESVESDADAQPGVTVVDNYPRAIVSLSPTATEMLFAIGAGDQVIAVDNYSYYPPEAPVVGDLSGFSPNVEAIAAFQPDLVLLSNPTIQEELELLGINVFVASSAVDLDEVYSQIAEIGDITGNSDGASVLVAQMKEQIEAIVASIDVPAEPLTYFHELDPTLYSVTSSTFIGQIYSMAGVENIADAADGAGTSQYPQLTQEFILESDPDIIFFADAQCCSQTVATISERPGWSELTAVRNQHVFEMNADIASRWGPRLVQFLDTVLSALKTVAGR